MDCTTSREALSAILDGEDPPCALEDLDAHLASCHECSQWREAAYLVTRRSRLTLAPAQTDGGQTDRILAAVLADQRARKPVLTARLARIGVAAAALAHGVIIVPALAGRAGPGIPMQTSRELAVFNLTIAFALFAAAVRPRRARAMTPVVGLAAGLLQLVDLADIGLGVTTWRAETTHLLTAAGAVLLVVLARNTKPGEPADGPTRREPPPGTRTLWRVLRRFLAPSGVAAFTRSQARRREWVPEDGSVWVRSRAAHNGDGMPRSGGDRGQEHHVA